MGHVARMRKMRNTCGSLDGKPEGNRELEVKGVDGKII